MKIVLLLISLSLLLSCDSSKGDSVIIGSYAGECTGICSFMVEVREQESRLDVSNTFFKSHLYDSIEFRFSWDSSLVLPEDDHRFFRELVTHLPLKLKDYSKEIGCPDCRDQGGIYLETVDFEQKIDPEWKGDPEIEKFCNDINERMFAIYDRYFRRRYRLWNHNDPYHLTLSSLNVK